MTITFTRGEILKAADLNENFAEANAGVAGNAAAIATETARALSAEALLMPTATLAAPTGLALIGSSSGNNAQVEMDARAPVFGNVSDMLLNNIAYPSGRILQVAGVGDYTTQLASGLDAIGPDVASPPNYLKITSNVDGSLSAKQFGIIANLGTDQSSKFSDALALLQSTGGLFTIPPGKFIVSGLSLDLVNVSMTPNGDLRRPRIIGAGASQTLLYNTTPSSTTLTIKNSATSITVASWLYNETISGICFGADNSTYVAGVPSCVGLYRSNLAYMSSRDLAFINLNIGIRDDGVLSSSDYEPKFYSCYKGMLAQKGSEYSTPNARQIFAPRFETCLYRALDIRDGAANFSIFGGNVETCGAMGDSTSGGIYAIVSGTNGGVSLNLHGVYFENNKGGADLSVGVSTSTRVTLNISGTNFNRVSSANYTTNNILIAGGHVNLNTAGNTHSAYNSYVPDISRPCIAVSTSTTHSDMGSQFSSTVDSPVNTGQVAQAGILTVSGAIISSILPGGWTATYISTGVVQVNHNIGNTNYVVTATSDSGSQTIVERVTRTNNTFIVRTTANTGTSGTLTDCDFNFTLIQMQATRP